MGRRRGRRGEIGQGLKERKKGKWNFLCLMNIFHWKFNTFNQFTDNPHHFGISFENFELKFFLQQYFFYLF